MAEKLDKWQKYDRLRMQSALDEIAASPNLRYFTRQLLLLTTVDTFAPERHEALAFNAGIQHVGGELRNFITSKGHGLKHQLEIEEENEILARLQNDSPDVASTDGGDSERPDNGDSGGTSDTSYS